GTEREVEALVSRFDGPVSPGLAWPEDPAGPWRWSLRVPPASMAEAIGRIPSGWDYLAVHGVGEVRAASAGPEGAADLRGWAESLGGRLVVAERPEGASFDPWGAPPPGLHLQRRLIEAFDPARVRDRGFRPGRRCWAGALRSTPPERGWSPRGGHDARPAAGGGGQEVAHAFAGIIDVCLGCRGCDPGGAGMVPYGRALEGARAESVAQVPGRRRRTILVA